MSKEAMKLALEALENLIPLCDPGFSVCYDVNKAITALREALAKPDFWEGYVPEPVKPAQQLVDCHATGVCVQSGLRAEQPAQQALDKKAENARELGLDYEPAKDNSNYRFDPPGLDPSHQKPVAWWIPKAKQFCLPSSDGTRPFAKAWEPLYTYPSAQRTWVGLTDAEVENLCLSLGAEPIEVRFIEAKLKEKNT